MSVSEKILCYIGPSLPLEDARALAPEATFRRPAKQSDIMSDVVELRPERILLVDGEFLQSLSVWHKEIVFALNRGVKVYGASSMGALRAADLWRQGMIGVGTIFEWFKNGVTEDDSEVALLYSTDPHWVYYPHTLPLVNLRATLQMYREVLGISHDLEQRLIEEARAVYFGDRTEIAIRMLWVKLLNAEVTAFLLNNVIDQKRMDAVELLSTFRELVAPPQISLDRALSKFFWAAYDRDRKITVRTAEGTVRVTQQHIDGYVALNSTDYPQIMWDAKNFHLTCMLAEKLGVEVTELEAEREWARFRMRHSIQDDEQMDNWLRSNSLTSNECCILMIRMAVVRKLHHWLVSSLTPLETTKVTLDYLKTHDAYQYWAAECALQESEIQRHGIDETLSVSALDPIEKKLLDHCQRSGITVDANLDEYIAETGFGTRQELGVALDRLLALEALK